MKKNVILLLLLISGLIFGQVGIGTPQPLGTFHVDGAKDNPMNGSLSSEQALNDVVVKENGNVGIGTTTPTSKLEITSGINGVSGLKFNNINSQTSVAPGSVSSLGINSNGEVVVESKTPLKTLFKSFSINSDTPTNSVITVGSLEFRFPNTVCVNSGVYYAQGRSTLGINNAGILHKMSRTQQNGTEMPTSIPFTFKPTFENLSKLPLDCVQDGHAEFAFFSYTDRTYYRVNIHLADGDNLGFGPLGYIFVEYQR